MQLLSYPDFLQILSEELSIPIERIDEDTLFRNLENWSSLNALILLSRIHEMSGKLITPAQLATVQTVQQLYNCINEEG